MRHDQAAGDHHRGHARGVDEAARQGGQLGGEEHGGDHADVHRQSAHPRRGLDVDVAFARVGHRAEPGGQDAHPAGGEVGDDRGGQTDERQLAQRNTGAAVGQCEKLLASICSTIVHHRMNRTGPT